MAMVREQDAFFVAGPAVDVLVALAAGRASFAAAAAGLAGGILVYLPQAIAYVRLNGHLGPDASVEHKMSWSAPHAMQVLFSPQHGFFVWTPLAAIGIGGLAAMTVRADLRRVALCLLLMVALQVYVGGCVESWTVAGAFGQRRFVALTSLLVIGLAAAGSRIARSPRSRERAAVTLALLAV